MGEKERKGGTGLEGWGGKTYLQKLVLKKVTHTRGARQARN